ncbi:MAG: NUDIX hydrolase [Eubacterium sp.]|nr:NUDIX hydrolase [Eubacterium sp.]
MVFKEETLESEYVFRGKLINVRRDKVTSVNGTSMREIVEHPGGVVMVALKPDGKVTMEKQYRKPMDGVMFELPAGKLDPGEKPEDAAARELREETGYTAKNIRYLTKSYTSCGYSTEILYAYLCTGLTAGETDLDDNEALDLEEYKIDKLANMVMSGEINDAKTQIAILMVKKMIDNGELDDYLW